VDKVAFVGDKDFEFLVTNCKYICSIIIIIIIIIIIELLSCLNINFEFLRQEAVFILNLRFLSSLLFLEICSFDPD
jgi:hypothetical protein